jgi:subtilisin family serine protease
VLALLAALATSPARAALPASPGGAGRHALESALAAKTSVSAHASAATRLKLAFERSVAIGGELVSAHQRRASAAAVSNAHGAQRVLVGLHRRGDLASMLNEVRGIATRVDAIPELALIGATTQTPGDLAARLSRDPRVAYVEPDRRLQPKADGDEIDPRFGIAYSWAVQMVNADAALAAVGGRSQRAIAILDTGDDVSHPDLAGRFAATYNAVDGSADVTDLCGHGTFVAGTIGMIDGNGFGGRGVAGSTQLLGIKASTPPPECAFALEDELRGQVAAIKSGARVLSMSLGGPHVSESQARTLVAAFLADVLPVAAAGNEAQEGNPIEFPGAIFGISLGAPGSPTVGLEVGAVKPDGQPADFSNFNRFMSVTAPGAGQASCHGVFSTVARSADPTLMFPSCPLITDSADPSGSGRWGYSQGTSFSAPIAAGIAALVWQANLGLQSQQVAHVLERSARQTYQQGNTQVGSRLFNDHTGWGLVDGAAAVELARRYDTTPPELSFTARKRRRRNVVSLSSSGRDLTTPGHELAGNVVYELDASYDRRKWTPIVRNQLAPIRRSYTLPRRKISLRETACDANENCTALIRGPFKAGRVRR